MDWRLLFILIGCYTALYFLAALLCAPGRWYLRKRFRTEFGKLPSEENIAALSPEQRDRWDIISREKYARTPFRWLEVFYLFLHYPSVIVINVLFKKDTLAPVPMYFVSGAIYVIAAYLRFGHRAGH